MRLAPAEQQVRLDQYGDPLPPGVIARLGSGRLRHGGPIWAVAFAPDSKTLASVSWDCTLRLWDMADGKERLRIWDDVPGQSRHPIGFLNHDCLVSVAFTRDGKTVAAASLNHPIRTWDVATGKWLHRFNVRSQQAIWMALSPDGRVLAHDARSRAIHLAEVATGKELARLSVPAPEDVHCGAFSPDGRIFAGGSEAGIVHLWEVVTGTERPRLVGHQQAVRSLVFLPDSKTLISSGKDNTIRFWEAATGKALRVLTLDERANEAPLLALSREGKMLFTGHRGLVQCWDTTTGKESHRFRAGESQLDYLALSPDGEALAAGGQDDYAVQLWNASTGQPLLRGSSPKSGLCAVVFSQDGRTLATGSGEDARVWDARTGQELHRFPGRGRITLTRDGSTLLTAGRRGDGRVYFWDLKTGQEKSFTQAHQGWVRLVAAAPDGRTFVSLGNQDEMLRLWDLATAREIHHFGGKQASFVTAVAFSPDSKPLATLHQDERVLRLWDVASGTQLHRLVGHEKLIASMAFSPDGKTLASGSFGDGMLYLWDVATGEECWHGKIGSSLDVLAFSPDGKTFAWGSQQEKSIHLWEVATRQLRHSLHGHQGAVTSLAYSEDNTRLASTSTDGTALVWDLTEGLPEAGRATLKLGPSELEDLERTLDSEDAVEAYRAMAVLKKMPAQAIAVARKRLPPVEVAEAQLLSRLIGDLDSDQFVVRERASRELEGLGEAAESAFRRALQARPTVEACRRLESLVAQLEARRLLPARVIEVLEHLGTPEAQALLDQLARGAPTAWLTREAIAAKDRLAKRF